MEPVQQMKYSAALASVGGGTIPTKRKKWFGDASETTSKNWNAWCCGCSSWSSGAIEADALLEIVTDLQHYHSSVGSYCRWNNTGYLFY
jgi:hypothetical protein